MKSKVWFLGIVTSGISSVCSLFNLRYVAVFFAIISIIILALVVILKE